MAKAEKKVKQEKPVVQEKSKEEVIVPDVVVEPSLELSEAEATEELPADADVPVVDTPAVEEPSIESNPNTFTTTPKESVITKIETAIVTELSFQAQKWSDYLDYLKMDVDTFIDKYPKHKFIEFIQEVKAFRINKNS